MKHLLLLLYLTWTASAQLPIFPSPTPNSGFTPNQIPSLVIWMDPSSGNGPDVSANNAIVGFWTNRANNALFTPLIFQTNNVGSGFGVLKTTGANGVQPCVYFTNCSYNTVSSPSTNWGSEFWQFYVIRSTNSGASNLDTAAIPMGSSGNTLLVLFNGTYRLQGAATTSGTGTFQIDSGFNYTNGWVLISMRCNGNGGANVSEIWTNGVQAATATSGMGTNNFQGPQTLASTAGATFIWRGFIAEMLMYKRALSSTERDNINSYLMNKYHLPDNTTTHTETTFVTGQTLGTLRANFSGNVGFSFTANQDLYLTKIGRWVVSGNSGSHNLIVFKVGGGQVGSNKSINTSGLSVGFNYVTEGGDLFLQGGARYIIESTELNGGDQWYDSDTLLTFTADGTSKQCALNNVEGSCGVDGRGQSYVPVSFKYYVP